MKTGTSYTECFESPLFILRLISQFEHMRTILGIVQKIVDVNAFDTT